MTLNRSRALLIAVVAGLVLLFVGVTLTFTPPSTTLNSTFELGRLTVSSVESAQAVTHKVDKDKAVHEAKDHVAARDAKLALKLDRADLVPGLTKIDDKEGWFQGMEIDGSDAWIVLLTGPGKGEFSHAEALIVVDAESGDVVLSAIVQNNE